jgi:hypothetical protein
VTDPTPRRSTRSGVGPPHTLRRADAVALLGGAALVVSPLLRWVRRGPGHTLSGRDMIDAVVALGGDVPGLSAARLAIVWYLVPAMGAAVWIAVGLHRGRRTVAAGAGVVTALAVVGFASLSGIAALGAGAILAGVGGVLAVVGLVTGSLTHVRDGHDVWESDRTV